MNTLSTFFTDTRITGLLYLGLAVSGMFAFLFARSAVYVSGDAMETTAQLLEEETLARIGIAAELALVTFQAAAAIWFYKIFSKVHSFAAGMLAAFGLMNAAAILIACAMWLSALYAAVNGDAAETVFSLFNLHENIWIVANVFFGLWLLPMAYLALKAKMPRILAVFLILGGVGYILAAFMIILFPNQVSLAELLPLPATIGEFWMIGYLLVKPQLNKVSSVQ